MEGENRVILGKKIREIRLKLGLTQEGLGKRANLHYSYIGQVERGNKVPSIRSLNKIANALNINVDSLLDKETGTEAETDDDNNILVRELLNTVKDCSPEELILYLKVIRQIRYYLAGLDKEAAAELSNKQKR